MVSKTQLEIELQLSLEAQSRKPRKKKSTRHKEIRVAKREKNRRKRARRKQRREKVVVEIPQKRIRKQVVLNFRSDEDPYYISIRAITINPEINETGLLIAVKETMSELHFDFSAFTKRYLGFSAQEIPKNVDTTLNDGRVYVEVFIKRDKPIIFKK